MPNFPKCVQIKEEGPREGFQIEKNVIPTERKIEFIDALSQTGLKTIQIVSCTEDLAFMCGEMGIETCLDLEKLIECARLAEDIVVHPLPGSVMVGGSLSKLRRKMAA